MVTHRHRDREDCPVCEREAEDRAEAVWTRSEEEDAVRSAERRYEAQLFGES